MNKIVSLFLIGSVLSLGSVKYTGSSTAVVTTIGGIIRAQHGTEIEHKYKRKDCPICKGKGWYMSGDDISKVDCGYCEPENKDVASSIVNSGTCKTQVRKK